MKITLALSALIAMAATAVSAAPANSGLSTRAEYPCRATTLTRYLFFPKGISNPDGGVLISFELTGLDRYWNQIEYKQLNGGTVTRKSSDKVWTVKHTEALWGLTLTVNGQKSYWEKVSHSTYDPATKLETSNYYTCVKLK